MDGGRAERVHWSTEMSATQSRQGGARVRFPPPFVFFGLTLAGLGLHYGLVPWPTPLERAGRLLAGALVGGAGLALALTARVMFKRSGQDPAPWKPSPSLLLRGPYRFSRNPMYLGVGLLQAGIGLALDDLWITFFAPVSLIVVHYIAVLPEEAYLAERFGEAYTKYRETVRRWL